MRQFLSFRRANVTLVRDQWAFRGRLRPGDQPSRRSALASQHSHASFNSTLVAGLPRRDCRRESALFCLLAAFHGRRGRILGHGRQASHNVGGAKFSPRWFILTTTTLEGPGGSPDHARPFPIRRTPFCRYPGTHSSPVGFGTRPCQDPCGGSSIARSEAAPLSPPDGG